MSNVLVTNKGMDFVTSAHDNGIYIDVRYFVPVYDDRIDGNVRDSINLSSFTQIANPSATTETVVGEVLWKRNDLYTLDTSNKYIISAASLNGLYQKATVPTNFNNSQPISDQISASSWTFSGSNGSYNVTANGGSTGVTGLGNTVTAVDNGTAWTTVGYHPVYDSAAQQRLRGNFSCLFQQSLMGNFKFNKILLFAVAVQEGSPTPVDTCLFAEAYMSATQEISNLGAGFDTVELEVQIDISGVSASFENLFYSSSADYWTHAPAVSGKGLHFDGLIGVNSYDGNQAAISAVMHLRKERAGVGLAIVDDIPLIRLDYDNNRYTSIDVDGSQYDVTESTTATVGKIGTDIIIKVANWNSYCGDAIAIRPNIASTVALGTLANPFRELHLKNSEVGDKNTSSIIPLNVSNQKNYAIAINFGDIKIGSISGYNDVYYNDPFGIRLAVRGIEIIDEKETDSSYLRGSFKGGDLLRQSQNLLIYNTGFVDSMENIYIFAGLYHNSSNFTSIDGQSGATHKNIVNAIEQEDMFWPDGDSNNKLNSHVWIDIAAKGRIGLFGPILLQNSRTASKRTAIIASYGEGGTGHIRTFIGAGLSAIDFDNISTKVDDIENGEDDNFQDILNEGSRLYLVANQIRIGGVKEPGAGTFDNGIIPLPGNSWGSNAISLGTDQRPFGHINTHYLMAYKRGSFGSDPLLTENNNTNQKKGLYIGNDIGTGLENNVTVGIVNQDDALSQIGKLSDPINYGFFENLKTDNFSANNGIYEYGRMNKMGNWKILTRGTDYFIEDGNYSLILEGGIDESSIYSYYTKIGKTIFLEMSFSINVDKNKIVVEFNNTSPEFNNISPNSRYSPRNKTMTGFSSNDNEFLKLQWYLDKYLEISRGSGNPFSQNTFLHFSIFYESAN